MRAAAAPALLSPLVRVASRAPSTRACVCSVRALYPIHRKDELAASTPAAAAGVASHRCGGMATACAVCCHSKDDAPGDRECRLPVECAFALEPAAPDCQSRCCRNECDGNDEPKIESPHQEAVCHMPAG